MFCCPLNVYVPSLCLHRCSSRWRTTSCRIGQQMQNQNVKNKPGKKHMIQFTKTWTPSLGIHEKQKMNKRLDKPTLGHPSLGKTNQNLDTQVLAKQHKPKLGQPSLGKTTNQNLDDQVLEKIQNEPKLGQPSLGKKQHTKTWTTKSWKKIQNEPKLGQPSLGKNNIPKLGQPSLGKKYKMNQNLDNQVLEKKIQNEPKLGQPSLGKKYKMNQNLDNQVLEKKKYKMNQNLDNQVLEKIQNEPTLGQPSLGKKQHTKTWTTKSWKKYKMNQNLDNQVLEKNSSPKLGQFYHNLDNQVLSNGQGNTNKHGWPLGFEEHNLHKRHHVRRDCISHCLNAPCAQCSKLHETAKCTKQQTGPQRLFRVMRSSLKGIQVVVDEGAPPECQGKM